MSKLHALRQFLATGLAGLMILSMTACASSTTSPVGEGSAPAPDGASNQSPTSGDAGNLSGKLVVFLNTGFSLEDLDEVMAERYPNLEIQQDSASSTEYETVVKTKLAAGEAPDIMTVWPGSRTSDYAEKGYLEPQTNEEYISRIPEIINREFSWDGNIYAMCYTVGGEGLFYNKKIFADNGLKIPKSLDEFKSVCDALKSKGIQPMTSGYKDDWVIMRYTNSAFATLGYGKYPNFDEDLTADKIDFSIGWTETFDKYKQLLDAGYFGQNILSTDNTQAIADFATGKVAMMIHTSETLKDIRDANPDFEIGFTATPVNDKDEKLFGMWKSGLGMAISSTSKNKDAAKAYLATLCEPEINEKIYAKLLKCTVITGVPATGIDPAIADYIIEYVDTENFALGAHDRWPAGMSNNWKKKLQEFVGGQISTDEMISWLNNEYESLK